MMMTEMIIPAMDPGSSLLAVLFVVFVLKTICIRYKFHLALFVSSVVLFAKFTNLLREVYKSVHVHVRVLCNCFACFTAFCS